MPLGEGYLADLLHSRTALIYGGYNSLTDVLFAGRPCVAVGRVMQDGEQDRHLQRLAALAGEALVVLDESAADPVRIEEALRQVLARPHPPAAAVNLAGAEQTLRHLARWLTPGGALAPGGQESTRRQADAQ
jgi:predicted glycosyltransferase